MSIDYLLGRDISIHALLTEGDFDQESHVHCNGISIHALLTEGDDGQIAVAKNDVQISIHALLTEGDYYYISYNSLGTYFIPRPPHGGRHKI